MGKIPSLPLALAPCRTTGPGPLSTTTLRTFTPKSTLAQQIRHATFIPRPRRPYTFTQLIQLTDGSTYTMRTTSPAPIYRTTKDSRNTLLWQPSEKSLRNVELDEAGKLAAFRERFGRGFDASTAVSEDEGAEGRDAADDDFADSLAGYARQDAGAMKDSGKKKAPTRRK